MLAVPCCAMDWPTSCPRPPRPPVMSTVPHADGCAKAGAAELGAACGCRRAAYTAPASPSTSNASLCAGLLLRTSLLLKGLARSVVTRQAALSAAATLSRACSTAAGACADAALPTPGPAPRKVTEAAELPSCCRACSVAAAARSGVRSPDVALVATSGIQRDLLPAACMAKP